MGRKVRRSAALEIVLDTAQAGSLQRQIGAQLRAAILERRLLPGNLLPSSRLMASELNDGEYRYSGRPLAPLRALDRSDRVAYLGSFSKILFPALRLSFLVLPAGLIEAARRVVASRGSGASLLGQRALARFIGDGHFAVHLRRTRLLYAARQERLIDAASRHLAGQLRIERDPGGMHLIGRPADPGGLDDVAVAEAAVAHGVKVGPLSTFYQAGAPSHGLILGYAGTPERDIEPAIQRLCRCLAANRQLPRAAESAYSPGGEPPGGEHVRSR